MPLDTQREKFTLQKEIEDFAKKEIEKIPNINAIDLVNILLGISVDSKSLYLRLEYIFNILVIHYGENINNMIILLFSRFLK